MTLHDVQRIFSHWQGFPPVRMLVAGFVSFKPKDPFASKPDYTTLDELKGMIESGAFGEVARR